MNSPYRAPGEEDKTEIAREKIRAAGELKKKLLEEREKTARARIEARGHWWISPWLVAGMATISMPIAAYQAYDSYLAHRYPSAFELQHARDCIETVEVISISDSVRSCPGGWMESEPVGPNDARLKVHCRCDPPGGASEPAKEKEP